jgi:hypothetical protein
MKIEIKDQPVYIDGIETSGNYTVSEVKMKKRQDDFFWEVKVQIVPIVPMTSITLDVVIDEKK